MPGQGQRMGRVVMAIHVADRELGLVDGRVERHGRACRRESAIVSRAALLRMGGIHRRRRFPAISFTIAARHHRIPRLPVRLPPRNGVQASTLQLPPGPWDTAARWPVRPLRGDRPRRMAGTHGARAGVRCAGSAGDGDHAVSRWPADSLLPRSRRRSAHSVRRGRRACRRALYGRRQAAFPAGDAGRAARRGDFAGATDASIRQPASGAVAPLDRGTAGLVLFSTDPRTRARYQALFPERRIRKCYEALAPALPQLEFPRLRATRLMRGEPFFRMCEVDGAANTETRIDVLEGQGDTWRYALEPLTGRNISCACTWRRSVRPSSTTRSIRR